MHTPAIVPVHERQHGRVRTAVAHCHVAEPEHAAAADAQCRAVGADELDVTLLDDDDGVVPATARGDRLAGRDGDLDPLERRPDHRVTEAERVDVTADPDGPSRSSLLERGVGGAAVARRVPRFRRHGTR